MIDVPSRASHVTDDEIDRYWKATLPAQDEARVEQHYLDCADCQTRVALVAELVHALQAEPASIPMGSADLRRWQAAAAVMAAIAMLTTWQWATGLLETRQPGRSGDAPASATGAHADEALSTIVALVPPTRDGNAATVTLASTGPVVIFEIDASEAGPPGGRLGVTLTDARGDVVLQLRGVVSTQTGIVRVPVERFVLSPGSFVFELTGGSTTVAVPLLIRLAAAP